MEPQKEVALFIDFENIRFGTLNAYGVEPRAALLIEKARKYGLVNIARAYADFEDFPSEVLRDLQVSGITAVNVQAHQVGDRKKSGADMDMLIDIIETMLDRAAIPTLRNTTSSARSISARRRCCSPGARSSTASAASTSATGPRITTTRITVRASGPSGTPSSAPPA